MDLIIYNDGMYSLVPVTKAMLEHIKIMVEVDCFDLCEIIRLEFTVLGAIKSTYVTDLCEIIRLEFTTYVDSLNIHMMKNGSGNFYGCICT